ncbi:imidazolonepropionase [Paenibacillus sp. ACRRX]|uniref:imidazolonepropionase n=1 Tax=Paenibacillus sp. ACRRX TaxID=2918206 RepID=UPI001EF5B765|nr:imidazolonepropionase [Paenibacillus sp. ACRRX]MCG7407229.1 imidazolonepropionase [Paenibacillus sp. ACRRX]
MSQLDLLVKGIGRLVTPIGQQARRGRDMSEVCEITNAAIAVHEGYIVAIGKEAELQQELEGRSIHRTLDAAGNMVTPGLIDPHTHLVHGGSREHELALKRSGVPYLDILAQGGGILSTVRSTREASEEQLYHQAKRSLDEMLLQGLTTIEAKSGYGLELEAELKQLRVVQRLQESHPIDLVSTFMGAHAVPIEYAGRTDEFVNHIIEKMLPVIAAERLAEFCDVFCEHGVFSVEQSRRILEAGKRYGLKPKIHADEIVALGGAELAGEIHAISAEHLLAATDQGLSAMSASGVVPVVLPGTSFNLGLTKHARARDMIDKFALPVALSTDYNPGSCPTESIQLIMMLASLNLKMSPEEILTACTLNAAAAIGRESSIGSIEIGKQADLTVWNATNLSYLPYHFGINHTFGVVKRGQTVVWNRQRVSREGDVE